MITYIASNPLRSQKTKFLLDSWRDDPEFNLASNALSNGYLAFSAWVWFDNGRLFESSMAQHLASNNLILEGLESLYSSGSGDSDVRGSFCVSSSDPIVEVNDNSCVAINLPGGRSHSVLFVPREICSSKYIAQNVPDLIHVSFLVKCIIHMMRVRSSKNIRVPSYSDRTCSNVIA